jgi:hypothetical protein
LLGDVMRAMALGHLVPARSKNRSCLARHPEEQGALFGPFEQLCSRRARLSEPAESRPKGDAEKVGRVQKGGKGSGRTATCRGQNERMKSSCPARMPVYGPGSKYLGRTENETEWRRFDVPQAPGNSHCAPTASGNSHCAPTAEFISWSLIL